MTADPDNELRDRSTGELLKQLSTETTTLVKQEIDLMKAANSGEYSRARQVG